MEGLAESHAVHNLLIYLVWGLLVLWAAKVLYQFCQVADVHFRLHQGLHWRGMSLHAGDIQQLSRKHFDQLQRMHAPPRPVVRHVASVHLLPDSINVWSLGEAFGLTFTVDASVPCRVQLFWGVSVAACTELSRRGGHTHDGVGIEMVPMAAGHLFEAGQYARCSSQCSLPAGTGQNFVTSYEDLLLPTQLPFDLCARLQGSDEVVPLVIYLSGPRQGDRGQVEGHSVAEAWRQVSLIRFRAARSTDDYLPGPAEVICQVSLGDAANEVHGVYGFESDGDGDVDCAICYSRPKNVVLFPCRHCSVCRQCLRSLRDETCPLCRGEFSSFIVFPSATTA
mmetsp:Transcript_40587/g.107563  ORF Transcript_40587/g.107563 Transcript_40587/m.107563 type:complete len:337 (-) Transcript_40587:190-1200(-)